MLPNVVVCTNIANNNQGVKLWNYFISTLFIYPLLQITLDDNFDLLEDKNGKIKDKHCKRGDKKVPKFDPLSIFGMYVYVKIK